MKGRHSCSLGRGLARPAVPNSVAVPFPGTETTGRATLTRDAPETHPAREVRSSQRHRGGGCPSEMGADFPPFQQSTE